MITPSPHINIVELRRLGFEALVDRLGAAGAIRFLQQFSDGSGDYTRERSSWLDAPTIEDVARSIEKRRQGDS